MPTGVGYCSADGVGWGSGSRDSKIRSRWTFFVGSPLGAVFSLLFPRRRAFGGRGPARSNHRGEVRGAVPQQRQEAFPLEPSELALQVVEVHPSKDLEELVLLQADRAALVEEHQDLVPKAALDRPGRLLPECAVDDLDCQRVEGVLHEGAG